MVARLRVMIIAAPQQGVAVAVITDAIQFVQRTVPMVKDSVDHDTLRCVAPFGAEVHRHT
jgi:hypothetical protein